MHRKIRQPEWGKLFEGGREESAEQQNMLSEW